MIGGMTDLGALVFLLAFFTLAVAFVKACERVIGADVEGPQDAQPATEDKVAA
jgi:hypothetical protein